MVTALETVKNPTAAEDGLKKDKILSEFHCVEKKNAVFECSYLISIAY